MQNNENLWYRMGYALENAKKHLPVATEGGRKKPVPADDVSRKVMDALVAVGAGSLLTRTLSLWPGRRGPGLFRLFRAGAAGAAAAFLADLARPVLTGKRAQTTLEERLADVLLAGVGRGLLYAALVEPRIPAPPVLQGAAYGTLEYALRPWGGLGELAGSKAPHGKVPALKVLLKDRGDDEQLVEHVAFGVALALLYDR